MTNKARELLERAIEVLDFDRGLDADDLMEEIRAYLAEPEVKREALSDAEIMAALSVDAIDGFQHGFWEGVRFAEQHHGVGDDNENTNT